MEQFEKVQAYIKKHHQWQKELELLRKIVLSADLEETIKWGAPVYTTKGKNVLGLGAFKSYVGIWFFQGSLLKDADKKLMNAQEGKTVAMRQWRFNSIDEMDEKQIALYVQEAIENLSVGRVVKPTRSKPLTLAKELKETLASSTELAACFEQLSLTLKREYADYIGEAKKEETRWKRMEKIKPMILEMKGLHDQYRK